MPINDKPDGARRQAKVAWRRAVTTVVMLMAALFATAIVAQPASAFPRPHHDRRVLEPLHRGQPDVRTQRHLHASVQ